MWGGEGELSEPGGQPDWRGQRDDMKNDQPGLLKSQHHVCLLIHTCH